MSESSFSTCSQMILTYQKFKNCVTKTRKYLKWAHVKAQTELTLFPDSTGLSVLEVECSFGGSEIEKRLLVFIIIAKYPENYRSITLGN